MDVTPEIEEDTLYNVVFHDHATFLRSRLCSLLEDKILTDVTIRCGSEVIDLHKWALAVISPHLRERLEKNPIVEQFVMDDFDPKIVAAIVNYMYYGRVQFVGDETLKKFMSTSKSLQIPDFKNFNKYQKK